MDTSAGGGLLECFAAMQSPGHSYGGVWETIMSQRGVQSGVEVQTVHLAA